MPIRDITDFSTWHEWNADKEEKNAGILAYLKVKCYFVWMQKYKIYNKSEKGLKSWYIIFLSLKLSIFL